MSLNPQDVEDLLAVLDSMQLDEFSLRTSRFALTLRRAGGGWTRTDEVLSEPNLLAPADPAPDPDGSRSDPDGSRPERAGPSPAPDHGLHEVRARLMGTFYRAPRPGAEPFVTAGDRVRPDTVIGIVETMKLMNSIPAGVGGTVRELCVADAEFVERGAVLVLIEPDGAPAGRREP